ncbi:cytidylate kinase-like family protein [Blautia schinkii]|nr:cytidylate kinase-like family protein [Blautia schinkii]
MDNFVITIARQYGSGGRTVGEMLSKKLGISYYDKDIIRMASEDSGIHERLFGRVDEYSSAKPPLFSKTSIYKGELIPPQSKEFTSDENLFNYTAKVIRHLAETESCVIIGRCSNYILKDYPNVLSVFIHASQEYRMQEASKKLSKSQREIEKFLQKDDKRKFEYYRRFTGGEWTDATNYDLCLDSSKLGYDRCIEEIEHRLNTMRQINAEK